MFGPDVKASLTTSELRQLVKGIRFIEKMESNPADKDALGGELKPLRDLVTKVSFSEEITDPRVKVFGLGRVGITGALQYALEHACSEWLARMDADDLMFSRRLEVQMDFI